MEQIKRCFNISLLVIASVLVTACGTTATGITAPPIKIIGNYKGNPIDVTIYPDGSKPTEVNIGTIPDEPIVIDLSKNN